MNEIGTRAPVRERRRNNLSRRRKGEKQKGGRNYRRGMEREGCANILVSLARQEGGRAARYGRREGDDFFFSVQLYH